MPSRLAITSALVVATLAALGSCAPTPDFHHGQWQAWLDSPGGDLRFGLELRETGDGLEATLINGEERLPVSSVAREGSSLILEIEQYDSRIEATLNPDGRRLDGRWDKIGVGGETTGLDFHAEAAAGFRTALESPDPRVLAALAGRWAVDFEKSGEPAVAIFETTPEGDIAGTFMTTTGDYRYLAGHVAGDRLLLSCFDGAHAFLFDARMREDGTLDGEFWSRDSWHERWSARKDAEARLPDAFELTRWVGGEELGDLAFPDLNGREWSLDDPAFAGQARILEIFGSWCPNCNDAARFLVELDEKYRDRGLSIVGLAFETSGEFERDAEQLRVWADHLGVRYPLLVAGDSDKTDATSTFPLIDRVRSYPTTIFMDRDGRVHAVHQGYTGPATGEAHHELRRRFETLVQELLAGVASDP